MNDLIKDKIFICSSFSRINEDNLKMDYDLSSEGNESKSPTKKLEEIFNNNFETEWKTYMINNRTKNSKNMYYDNKISSFNFLLKSKDQLTGINKNINKENKRRGRKRKGEDNGNNNDKETHNKFSDDNLRKKCKNIILKFALEFINKKIRELYKNNIRHGRFKKELKILDQEKIAKSTVCFEKSFIKKTLKDIFSCDISVRFYNFPRNYNKSLIESLLEDEDEDKRRYFTKLFDITFIECLKYFTEDKEALTIRELNGFKHISSIKDELIMKFGKEYFEAFINYLQNYENIVNNKIGRKRKKTKNQIQSPSNEE